MNALPVELENLIIDYMWSHKMYLLKCRVHQEMMYYFLKRIFRMSLTVFIEQI